MLSSMSDMLFSRIGMIGLYNKVISSLIYARYGYNSEKFGGSMAYTTVLTEIRGRVGLVILNRPQAMNAFNTLMLNELFDALSELDLNDAVGAMVVTGNEKAFAAGADIKEMAESSPFDMIKLGRVELWDRIRSIKKPVIAAVSGWVLGGGCEFSISCDMIVASETAKFGQPEITIGITPGGGGT